MRLWRLSCAAASPRSVAAVNSTDRHIAIYCFLAVLVFGGMISARYWQDSGAVKFDLLETVKIRVPLGM